MRYSVKENKDGTYFVKTETRKGVNYGYAFSSKKDAAATALQMSYEYHLQEARKLWSKLETDNEFSFESAEQTTTTDSVSKDVIMTNGGILNLRSYDFIEAC